MNAESGLVVTPVEGLGLYRFEGDRFRNFSAPHGLTSRAVQCTFQDRDGRIWCGGYEGLFRLEGDRFVPVTRGGPWR
jgi:ligand-binding sensor domain-containing protein